MHVTSKSKTIDCVFEVVNIAQDLQPSSNDLFAAVGGGTLMDKYYRIRSRHLQRRDPFFEDLDDPGRNDRCWHRSQSRYQFREL